MLSPQPRDIAATARAFATYSLVPYLGILFCPGAVLVGSFGVVTSYRGSGVNDGSRVVCYVSVLVGFVVFAIQILLWWILYKVPTWSRGL
jgi:hypothetical protein